MEKEEVLDFEEEPRKKRKLKTKFKILLILFILFIVLVVGLFGFYNYMLSGVKTTSEVIEFEVSSGSSVYQVGEKLEKEGIIRSFLVYKIYVKLNNINEYKAGIYKLDKSYNTRDIVELLTGNTYKKEGINITFKEGITIKKIAKEIEENTNISENEFYLKLEDTNYIDSLIEQYWFLTDDIKNENIYYPLEGYLFPETYSFSKNATIEEIIKTMLDQTDKVLSKHKALIDKSSYTVNELVTLASIVEKEGIYDDDRKSIASVFYNRLNAGMALGSDVTTYYAFKVELSERDLTKAELNTYNPYNTRGPKMEGKLPVGAISNFSETSFEAVVSPISSDYYYFVADNTGNTYFTKTYSEHQKKVNELKQSGKWIQW